ncbi:MAG: hypothetical protein J6V12_05530 [Bacteroidaceae bacterium]|nr:hypothetical protein [Bacteroidaceae bacterium]
MIEIPQQKRVYWDKKLISILELIRKDDCESTKITSEQTEPDVIVLDSAKIISEDSLEYDIEENIISVTHEKAGVKYIIEKEAWKSVEECINDFYKLQSIKNKISKDSLRILILSWLFDVREKEQITVDFSRHIEEGLEKLVKEYVVYFPIPYLSSINTYKFSNDISLGRLSNKQLENSPVSIRGEYTENTTFIYTNLSGEKELVAERAYERCSLAIDIIKICYLTFYFDQPKVCLDIADNIPYSPIYRCFIQETSSDTLHINIGVNAHLLKLDNVIRNIEEHCINDYKIFIDRIFNQTKTELEEILIAAIKAFSNALSHTNDYDRVVDLCSILDSLILVDENIGIKQSLKRYVPLIISDIPDIRKIIRNNIEKMYEIRSQYIHHRKTEIKISKRKKHEYNNIVFNLLTEFVIMANSEKYKTARDVIKKIDVKLNENMDTIIIDL